MAHAYIAQQTAEQNYFLLEWLASLEPMFAPEEALKETPNKAPNLSDLRFRRTKITKHKKEFLLKIEAISKCFNGFFAHLR